MDLLLRFFFPAYTYDYFICAPLRHLQKENYTVFDEIQAEAILDHVETSNIDNTRYCLKLIIIGRYHYLPIAAKLVGQSRSR